jgi:hypothetical protein
MYPEGCLWERQELHEKVQKKCKGINIDTNYIVIRIKYTKKDIAQQATHSGSQGNESREGHLYKGHRTHRNKRKKSLFYCKRIFLQMGL